MSLILSSKTISTDPSFKDECWAKKSEEAKEFTKSM